MANDCSTNAEEVKLLDVYDQPGAEVYLYALLQERDGSINISHQVMPTPAQHLRFVHSHPYRDWCLIDAGEIVGATYLTKQNEIGIFIFKMHQGRGLGKQALALMKERHQDRRLLANINPDNTRSAELFRSAGFKLVQHTYAY